MLVLALTITLSGCSKKAVNIPYWAKDSIAMKSIVSYVASVTDEKSSDYIPASQRIVVFDMDGTLYGELFPSYFDDCLLIHRLLHDDNYKAPEEYREYAEAFESALLSNEPEPDSPKSGAQIAAESFQGLSVEEYQAYIKEFMSEPAIGFEGMSYGEGFFQPMIALVKYLYDNDFTIFISSGSERTIVRELINDTLGEWIPPYNIIGSSFTLKATSQGDTDGRKYNFSKDDEVLLEGNLEFKNQKTNKVFTIVEEIGVYPLLVFGNSSSDLAMAQYALQHGGKAYMLLCDDTERDYGDISVANEFADACKEMGIETISMRDEFETIYGSNVKKTQINPN